MSNSMASVGVNFSQSGGWSANAFGFNYSSSGLIFDPSISVSYSINMESQTNRQAQTQSTASLPDPMQILAQAVQEMNLISGASWQAAPGVSNSDGAVIWGTKPAEVLKTEVIKTEQRIHKSNLKYDVNKAVFELNKNANERSVHLCGRYIGYALKAGGINVSANGKDYGPILIKNNFNVLDKSGYSPQKGDVVIYDGNTSHKWGHVQMYNGKEWVSDFKQGFIGIKQGYEYGGRGFMVYSKNIPNTAIYRYNSK